MARAIIPGFAPAAFGNLPDVRDDVTNGWVAKFQVVYTGEGAIDGFMRDEFEVHFLDTDNAAALDNKMRDAARARATELGIPSASTMKVTAFVPPRLLT
jgi:hypothetical protein